MSITFTAQGYSRNTSGQVTDKWFEYWAWFPNTISGSKTWTAAHPFGQYAKGSIEVGIGFNSKWGAIGIGSGRRYYSLLF